MPKYFGGDTIKGIEYPKFEEYVKEHEKRIEDGDINSIVDVIKYGGEVWKFLSDMQTKPAKPLEKIPGHYDKFLKNVKAIFKKYGGSEPTENSVLCFMDNKFIPELYAELDKYIEEGKNEERINKTKEFIEKSFKLYTRRVTEGVLCSSDSIKNKTGAEKDRDINNKLYTKVYLGGKIWETTMPTKEPTKESTKEHTSIFEGHEYMRTLTLGKGVKIVNTGTFVNCKKLRHVYIEADDLTIDKGSFKNCDVLDKLQVCSSVKKLKIKKEAFDNCKKLDNIDVSSFSGDLNVEEGAFSNCGKLRRASVSGDDASKVVETIRAVLPE